MSSAHVYCEKGDQNGSDSDGSFFVPACPPPTIGLLKKDLSQQEVLSPPLKVGIISQVL